MLERKTGYFWHQPLRCKQLLQAGHTVSTTPRDETMPILSHHLLINHINPSHTCHYTQFIQRFKNCDLPLFLSPCRGHLWPIRYYSIGLVATARLEEQGWLLLAQINSCMSYRASWERSSRYRCIYAVTSSMFTGTGSLSPAWFAGGDIQMARTAVFDPFKLRKEVSLASPMPCESGRQHRAACATMQRALSTMLCALVSPSAELHSLDAGCCSSLLRTRARMSGHCTSCQAGQRWAGHSRSPVHRRQGEPRASPVL